MMNSRRVIEPCSPFSRKKASASGDRCTLPIWPEPRMSCSHPLSKMNFASSIERTCEVPQIESYQYRNDAARQDPTPVRKGPYRQRKNHLRNALNHKVHEQQEREHEKARRPMTNQKHADYHR